MSQNVDRRLSARVFSKVLNQPLYDGACSQKARGLLADGNVEAAIDEWRRLADLGSGNARCVLAYIHFRGAPTIEPDLDRAKELASAAATASRGYANYLLGCFALSEGSLDRAVTYFKISYETNFIPVLTVLAWTRYRYSAATRKNHESAESLALRAIGAGHLPARGLLARIYVGGQLGWRKKIHGRIVFPWALAQYVLGVRSDVFSVYCFHYSPTFKQPLFAASTRYP